MRKLGRNSWELPEMLLTWGTSGHGASGDSTNTRHWLEPIHFTARHGQLSPSTRFGKRMEREYPIPGRSSDCSVLFPSPSRSWFKRESGTALAICGAGMGRFGPPFLGSWSPLSLQMYHSYPRPHYSSPTWCLLLSLETRKLTNSSIHPFIIHPKVFTYWLLYVGTGLSSVKL